MTTHALAGVLGIGKVYPVAARLLDSTVRRRTFAPPKPMPSSDQLTPLPAVSDPRPDRRASIGWFELVFAATTFVSAFLLFQVQPLMGKAILPWFGGTPGVWTTCMLVFQTLLFLGYGYAHLLTRSLATRTQIAVHTAVLTAAVALLLWLGLLPGADWKPHGDEEPTLRITLMLTATIALPFLVLSTTGPLLQRWFSLAEANRSPYRLYAVSNAGSLLALLSYPFVVEPWLALSTQAASWSAAFLGFAIGCAACGVVTASRAPGTVVEGDDTATVVAGRPETSRLAFWFTLAVLPSVLLLATTNQVCLDVASVPFLWVVPLSLYLLSFILCFESERWYVRPVFAAGVLIAAPAMVLTLLAGPAAPLAVQIAVYFAGLFVMAMFCHGELARSRPEPRHLTLFYLVISAGGATGGIFVGIVAPLVFPAYWEFHAGIAGTCLVLLMLFDEDWLGLGETGFRIGRLALLPLLVLTVAGLAYEVSTSRAGLVDSRRSFYGVLRVVETDGSDARPRLREMYNGRISHGTQFLDPTRQRVPTRYYGRNTGVGRVLSTDSARPRNVGVVGLGTGTLATYAKAGDEYRFYEINADVVELAVEHFTYLADCRGDVELALGDARLSLEREPPQGYDVLVLDAFSSDAIPTHLLTREAFDVYLQHVAEDGLLALHVSNQHFDLVPVLADHAATFGLSAHVVDNEDDPSTGTSSARWVLMAREPSVLTTASGQPRYGGVALPTARRVAWTDETCNLLSVLAVSED